MTATQQFAPRAAWREAFADLDRSRWPGPRPLRGTDDPEVLVGRDGDKVRFRREVKQHRLILLTGMTGVGKTSLLEAGLVPDLRAAGLTVALCRDWSRSAQETDPVAFLAGKMRAQYAKQVSFELPEGAALFWKLNEELHERCVVVLDQFEELIRDAPDLTDRIFALLVEVNRRTDLRVVVSFRSEYLHEMADLESKVQAFSLSHMALNPVDPDVALEIVQAPDRHAAPGTTRAITDKAAKRVATLWAQAVKSAPGSTEERRAGRIGLLHLQALLYVLSARCGERTVQEADVAKFQDSHGSPSAVFRQALHLAVQEKLNRCRRAAGRLDHYLLDGTLQMVVEAVPHLSSAGYKLVRDVRDLANATFGDRLDSLELGLLRSGAGLGEPDGEVTTEQEAALLGALLELILPDRPAGELDLLSASRRALAERADAALPHQASLSWVPRLHDGLVGPEIDAADVTCGPMLGYAPAAVLIEELRRFVFALEWLQASDLIRISTPETGGAMIALIHDGFGVALEDWARAAGRGPRGQLAAITAPRGASFEWGETPERPTDHEQTERTAAAGGPGRLLVNLRWRGAWVTARFTDVVFVNCDFRGTGFSRCVFDGVAFVNCLLDGAMFTDCTVTGDPPPAHRDWYPHAPRFVIPEAAQLVAELEHYNESALGATELLSQLPGLPALPLSGDAEGALPLEEKPAGLVVLGGRISTLMVRSLAFEGGSSLSFRHVAGSGLDIVEQRSGRFEVIGSALRHVTFSGVPEDRNTESGELQIDLVVSSIVQLWVSDDVSGNLLADDCMLLQAWNASTTLKAQAQNCTYAGLVGFTRTPECTMLGPDSTVLAGADIDSDGRVHTRVNRMDYRRDPHRARLTAEESSARLSAH